LVVALPFYKVHTLVRRIVWTWVLSWHTLSNQTEVVWIDANDSHCYTNLVSLVTPNSLARIVGVTVIVRLAWRAKVWLPHIRAFPSCRITGINCARVVIVACKRYVLALSCCPVAIIECAKIVVIAVLQNPLANTNFGVTNIIRALVSIVTVQWRIYATCQRITRIYCALVIVVTVDSLILTASRFCRVIGVYRARISIIAVNLFKHARTS
jgi:hypothetical protein